MTKEGINLADYPTQISCKVMPPVEEGITEIEVADAEDTSSVFNVPSAAVAMLPAMPQLPAEMPPEAHELIKQGAGLGLVACRLLEKNEKAGLIKVELPTLPDGTMLTLPENRIPRRL